MKIASRYLLPLEVYLAITMIAWGVAGGIGEGPLNAMLRSESDPRAWVIALGGIGIFHLLIAASELWLGRRWRAHFLFTSISGRCVALFLSTGAWIYVCYLMLSVPGIGAVISLAIQAPFALGASMWAYVGNLRVRYVLNPEISTARLQSTLLAERLQSAQDGR